MSTAAMLHGSVAAREASERKLKKRVRNVFVNQRAQCLQSCDGEQKQGRRRDALVISHKRQREMESCWA